MLGSRRILVVDDDPASCDLITYFLKSLGYHVAILWSTAAGLPVYRRLGFVERVRVPTYLGPGS